MEQATSAWEIATVVAAVWSATTLAGAAAQALRPRPIDLWGQSLGTALAVAGLGGTFFVLGLQLDRGAVAWAFGLGLLVGYGSSTLAGYKDDAGEAVMPGSVWFLVPWGVSAVGMLWGSLATSADGLALGVLGIFASTGIGVGQLVVAGLAVRSVSRAWDDRPVPADLDLVAELMASGETSAPEAALSEGLAEACPNGHLLPAAGLHFCPLCGTPVRCPAGHPIRSANAAFCVECGSPLRQPVSPR